MSTYTPLHEPIPSRTTAAPGLWLAPASVRALRRRQRRARLLNTAIVALAMVAVASGGILLYQAWWTNQVAFAEHAATVEDLSQSFTSARTEDALGQRRVMSVASGGLSAGVVIGDPDSGLTATQLAQQERDERALADGIDVGTPIAVVHIPKFGHGWASPVVAGVDDYTLRSGVGWAPYTSAPGEIGNVGLAGHRNTWGHPFRQVHELQPGDEVIIETVDGWYTYTKVGYEIVMPTSTQVWAAVPNKPEEVGSLSWLTMVACHPIGSDDERWITYAQMSGFTPRDAGPPESLTAPAPEPDVVTQTQDSGSQDSGSQDSEPQQP